MNPARTIFSTLLASLLATFALAAVAHAAEPATVTVRVEGSTETLLPASTVTTTRTPVVKDGEPADSCPGEDAIGALELATKGNWSGKWEAGFGEYVVETILGESHLFTSPTYWEFWIDHQASSVGACNKELKDGDTLLFFPGCFGAGCPPPPNPLDIQAPPVAATGEKVTVAVTSYANGTGAPSPAAGATLSYEGRSVEADASGHATLEFAHAGSQVVKVTKAESVRTEATVCVHVSGDGGCNTAPAPAVAPPAPAPVPYKGPFALVAGVTSVRDGALYSHRSVPRLISGRISSHSSVSSVSLSLRRTYRRRCSSFDAVRGRFVRSRCGSAVPFQVSREANFSYLLPLALARGRYVLDVEANDIAGNTTTLARGTSRLVFFVR